MLASNLACAISDRDFQIFEFSNSSYAKTIDSFVERNPELVEIYYFILAADFNTKSVLDKLTSNEDLLNEFEDYSLNSLFISKLKLYEYLIGKQNKQITAGSSKTDKSISAYSSHSVEKCEYNSDSNHNLEPEIAYELAWSKKLDKEFTEIFKEITKESKYTLHGRDSFNDIYAAIDNFRNFLKTYGYLFEVDEYYTKEELEKFWNIHASLRRSNNFINANDYGNVSFLDKALSSINNNYSLVSFNFTSNSNTSLESKINIDLLDILNLIYPIDQSHKEIFEISKESIKQIEYKSLAGLKIDILNDKNFPYYVVGSYFDESFKKQNKEDASCNDLVQLIDQIRISNNISRISIEHIKEVQNITPIGDEVKKRNDIVLQRFVPTLISKHLDYVLVARNVGQEIHGEYKWLPSSSYTILDINNFLNHMRYVIETKNTIKLKKESVNWMGDDIEGEIIQFGEFAFFRSLNKEIYLHFFNSNWMMLESFQDKVDFAIYRMKENNENSKHGNPTKDFSLVMPVLNEKFDQIRMDLNDVQSSSKRTDHLHGYINNITLKNTKELIIDNVTKEYCQKLGDIADRIFEANSPIGLIEFYPTPEELAYFGGGLISMLDALASKNWSDSIHPQDRITSFNTFGGKVISACEGVFF